MESEPEPIPSTPISNTSNSENISNAESSDSGKTPDPADAPDAIQTPDSENGPALDPTVAANPPSTNVATAKWRGRLLVAVAAIMWSTSGLFAKAPIFETWPESSRGLLLAFWRAAFASLILITMVRKIQWTWKLLPMVAAFALMNWTYLNGMVLCEATLAIWLQYTAPLWACLFAWKLFGETPERKDAWLVGLASVGLVVILWPQLAGTLDSQSSIGVLYGLASGLFFAAVVVLIRWNNNLDAAWLIFLNHAVTAILFLPFVVIEGAFPSTTQLGYLCGFGMLQLGLPYLLLAIALSSVTSHEASGLTLLEPILVPVWVWLAWSHMASYDPPRATTLIGGGLILAGLMMQLMLTRSRRTIQMTTPENA
ncbi:MAG: DMT family transporter [Planctomycetota bacterium]